MITIISGTNRLGSNTRKVAQAYGDLLDEQSTAYNFFSLEELPQNMLSNTMYEDKSEAFKALEEKYLIKADKFLIVMPEYNGGVPGILKLMIDASDIKNAWAGKKAALVGVSAGRAGNLRGLDVLTNMLNYIKVNVLANKLPISQIGGLLEDDAFKHEETIAVMKTQLEQFLQF